MSDHENYQLCYIGYYFEKENLLTGAQHQNHILLKDVYYLFIAPSTTNLKAMT